MRLGPSAEMRAENIEMIVPKYRTGPVGQIQRAKLIENLTAENLTKGPNKYKTEQPKMTVLQKKHECNIYPVFDCG